MGNSRRNKLFWLKLFSLFSVVRGYNILVIAIAQYLAALFILGPKDVSKWDILLDQKLFLLVWASTFAIASGYIINNFYDSEKDLINRPNKSLLDRLVSQKTKLYVYFVMNFIAAALGLLVSWRVALFYSFYIFLLWFYSHKLKKYPLIGNITACIVSTYPFFGLLLYYAKPDAYHYFQPGHIGLIFAHAFLLLLLLFVRELVKDLENLKGDLAANYQTIPVAYGEKYSKIAISISALLTLIPAYLLIEIYPSGYMNIYLYVLLIALLLGLRYLWKASTSREYFIIYNGLKALIVLGVFSVILIDSALLDQWFS